MYFLRMRMRSEFWRYMAVFAVNVSQELSKSLCEFVTSKFILHSQEVRAGLNLQGNQGRSNWEKVWKNQQLLYKGTNGSNLFEGLLRKLVRISWLVLGCWFRNSWQRVGLRFRVGMIPSITRNILQTLLIYHNQSYDHLCPVLERFRSWDALYVIIKWNKYLRWSINKQTTRETHWVKLIQAGLELTTFELTYRCSTN